MGLSIQEQLLKAGIVDKKKVKQVEHEKRVQKKKKKKAGHSSTDNDKLRLQQQQAEQAKKDFELNAERNLLAQKRADMAAATQLIDANQLTLEEGDVVYQYVEERQIRKIWVTPAVAEKLATGRAGLAVGSKGVALISADVVAKVLARNEDLILVYNDPDQLEDEYPSDWS